jgi:predicted small lipoprotein YifL
MFAAISSVYLSLAACILAGPLALLRRDAVQAADIQ